MIIEANRSFRRIEPFLKFHKLSSCHVDNCTVSSDCLLTWSQAQIESIHRIWSIPLDEALDCSVSGPRLHPAKGQTGRNGVTLWFRIPAQAFWNKVRKALACFREEGKVRQPHCSGVQVTSLVACLQDLQTEAHATRSLREGQERQVDSTRATMLRRSSGGRFAHPLLPCWWSNWEEEEEEEEEHGEEGTEISEEMSHIWRQRSSAPLLVLPFEVVLMILPFMWSFSSWKKFFNDISVRNPTARRPGKKWRKTYMPTQSKCFTHAV